MTRRLPLTRLVPGLCLALCLAGLSGAAARAEPAAGLEAQAWFGAPEAEALRLRSTTDIAVLGPALEAFVTRHPEMAVAYEQWSSNGLYEVTRADCEAQGAAQGVAGNIPGADAAFSSAVDQLVELVNLGCAQPYRSEATAALPEARRWRDEIWGLTREPAVIIYNSRLVPPEDVPSDRFALLDLMRRPDSRYAGRIATYDIEASGLGYFFAFADSLEASTFGALLEGFERSGAVATCCSAEIIDAVARGEYLIAYNVLGSYVEARAAADVATVWPADYTLFLSRAYMIPKGAARAGAAAMLLDFLLAPEGQAILARSGLVARAEAEGTAGHESALRPIRIGPVQLVARDAQKVTGFIRRWRETFTRRDGATAGQP